MGHPKKPDVEEELEKTKEKAYKSDSTNKEATSKVEMKLKKKAADSQEMKEKNENFSKAERKTKGAEIDSKNSEQECSNKSEKVSKEASTKVDSKDNEGSNKVATVEAAEQATKEKHSKNPFYGLDMYAKKIQGLKEVFTKTKAAYERKCKSKEQEVQTKAYYQLKKAESGQETSQKESVQKTKEYESKTEKTTKEKVMKVQSAAENLEKATHERCDKTIASSEKSDKWEVSHWSAELASLKAQCKSVQKAQEKDQKAFTFSVCEAAPAQIAAIAEDVEGGDEEEL